MKRITSPSYAKSAIYPVTVGDRLFAIRDWGADWTSDDRSFGIEELDPQTGAPLSSSRISAEWFTIAGDNVYYRNKVNTDLFGNYRSGGEVVMKGLGSAEERELSGRDVRFRGVGERLVSVSEAQLRQHDASTGEVQTSRQLAPGLLEQIWPSVRSIFYGDDALYWAARTGSPNRVEIMRVPLSGEPEMLTSLQLAEGETGLILDDAQGWVMIATTGSSPPRGIAVKRIFLFNQDARSLEELSVDQHIPTSHPDAGWGLQILVMP